MGCRGQICIKQNHPVDNKIYLYTHWDGYRLIEVLRDAFNKKYCWDDDEYLTRIIFCQMIKGDISGTSGFGIGHCWHGDLDVPRIVVSTGTQEVNIEGLKKFSFCDFTIPELYSKISLAWKILIGGEDE